jgi:hypothetical protein
VSEWNVFDLWDFLLGDPLDLPVSDRPCDDCGMTGQSKMYVDGDIFQLCAACAWKLTDEYHEQGLHAPWERPA